MEKDNKNEKKESILESLFGTVVADNILDIPVEIGKTIVEKVSETDIPKILSSAKDTVGEHIDNISDIAGDTIKEVGEGLGNIIGDVVDGIDL